MGEVERLDLALNGLDDSRAGADFMVTPAVLEPVPEKCGRFPDKNRLKLKGLEPVPEKCGRFSDKNRLKLKGLEHFR